MTQLLSRQAFSLRRMLLGGFFFLLAMQTAWAGGDPSDGHSHAPEEEAAPVVAVTGGATETAITLRLSDLTKGSASTPAPLEGALIEGTVKEAATGKTLGTITGEEEGTPGLYKIHFGEQNREAFGFPAPGRYQLAVNIEPEIGNGVETVIGFNLPAPPTPPAAPVPLWRRVLPLGIGALALGVLLFAFLKWRRNRKAPPSAPVVAALLCLLLPIIALQVLPAWAHEGEVHEDEEEAALHAVTAPATDAPNIAPGEVTVSTKAGNIGIALTATTSIAAPQVLAPGEVTLPPQTAQLLNIQTQPVTVAQLATGINFSGQIAPNPNGVVRVASIVPGRVTRLNAAQGDTVKQGEVVAIVESRAIGEAQSAYQQAQARYRNAQSNLNVVREQARAGVFSRAPLETVQKAQAEAAGEVRQQEAAVQQAQVALNNATRVARAGGFASPALETARNNEAQAREALQTAQAAQANAQSSVESAQAELARRRQLAASGSYQSRPVEEARRALVAAQSARAAAQSEVATTRTNLSRAKSLAAEGLISQRDLEAAQQAYDTATARLETSQADERTAQQELARQQELASSNVAGTAEVQAAQSTLAAAQADVRTRQAEAQRARSQLQVANAALSRERTIFEQGIANRREIETARANLQAAQAGLYRAQRVLATTNTQLEREQTIFRRNLNNTSQVQAARAGFVAAQADVRAARSTLELLKSSPGGSVSVPVRAPMSGVVQTRDVAVGELIQADAPLLTIVNLQSVALEANLFEADFARVRIGSPVRITSDAAPGRTFSGRITFLGSQVNPETRTVTARALIDNPGNLRPGMFARGQIQTGVGNLSVTAPETAVLDDGAAKIVFVAKGDRYERREVTVGNASNGRVEIKSGVQQGERVVTEGAAALRAQAARGV